MANALRWPASAAAKSPRFWSRTESARRLSATSRCDAAVEPLALGQRLLEERLGAIVQPQAHVDLSDGERERRLRLRLILELGHHPRSALVQDLPRRHRLPTRFAGIGPREHLLEEARDLQGLVALGPDLVPLASEADRLHGHRGGQAEDHREARGRRADTGLVAAHELARAVLQGVGLRRDGQLRSR